MYDLDRLREARSRAIIPGAFDLPKGLNELLQMSVCRVFIVLDNLYGLVPAELSLLSSPKSSEELMLRGTNVKEPYKDKMGLFA